MLICTTSEPSVTARKPRSKPYRRRLVAQLTTRRLVGYVRVSREDARKPGLGAPSQRQELARWAAAAHGLELVDIVEDLDVSGGILPHKRPGFAQVMAAIEDGRADGVLALDQDRVCRDTEAWLALRRVFAKHGWTVALVSEGGALKPRSEQDAGEAFVEVIRAQQAEDYRRSVKRKTLRAMAQLRSDNRAGGRWAPFGFKTMQSMAGLVPAGDKSELHPEPAEYRQLQRILDLRREGWGCWAIAARMGINARTGKPFLLTYTDKAGKQCTSARSIESILRTQARWAEA